MNKLDPKKLLSRVFPGNRSLLHAFLGDAGYSYIGTLGGKMGFLSWLRFEFLQKKTTSLSKPCCWGGSTGLIERQCQRRSGQSSHFGKEIGWSMKERKMEANTEMKSTLRFPACPQKERKWRTMRSTSKMSKSLSEQLLTIAGQRLLPRGKPLCCSKTRFGTVGWMAVFRFRLNY